MRQKLTPMLVAAFFYTGFILAQTKAEPPESINFTDQESTQIELAVTREANKLQELKILQFQFEKVQAELRVLQSKSSGLLADMAKKYGLDPATVTIAGDFKSLSGKALKKQEATSPPKKE